MIGIYTLGYQLGQVIALVALSLNAAWVPFFYARGEGRYGPALLRELTTLSIGGLGILAVLVSALAPEAVAILAPPSWGPEADRAALVAPLVALACTLQGVYLMAVSPVFLQRRTAVLPLITISAGALNVGLNVFLIPALDIVGAGLATVVGYGALAGLTIWYARRGYDLRLDAPRLAALFGAGIALVLVSRVLAPDASAAGFAIHLAFAAAFVAISLPILRSPWRAARSLVPQSNPSSVPSTAPSPG
jgi:O-antigen/teichoic acid export membrane protein